MHEINHYLYGGASREILDGMYCGEVNIERIIDLLISEYGEYKWRQRQDPLSVLIQTILSQNTSDVNSRRAFESIRTAFDNWEAVSICLPTQASAKKD